MCKHITELNTRQDSPSGIRHGNKLNSQGDITNLTSENEIVNQIHLYECMLKSHELNCEGIVALKMNVCK